MLQQTLSAVVLDDLLTGWSCSRPAACDLLPNSPSACRALHHLVHFLQCEDLRLMLRWPSPKHQARAASSKQGRALTPSLVCREARACRVARNSAGLAVRCSRRAVPRSRSGRSPSAFPIAPKGPPSASPAHAVRVLGCPNKGLGHPPCFRWRPSTGFTHQQDKHFTALASLTPSAMQPNAAARSSLQEVMGWLWGPDLHCRLRVAPAPHPGVPGCWAHGSADEPPSGASAAHPAQRTELRLYHSKQLRP